MKKNIDDLTMDLVAEMTNGELKKALPPKIAYRLRQWLKRQGRSTKLMGPEKVAEQIAKKMEAALSLKELKKNQFMARVHDDGVVKMDFGSDVPEHVRKAAMAWAKRKGLQPVEASLAKSGITPYSVTYAPENRKSEESEMLAKYVWEIAE